MKPLLVYAGCLLCALQAEAQDRFPVTRLTSDPAQEGFASWAPDGTYLVHSSFSWGDSLGRNGIWKIEIDRKVSTHLFSGIAEHPKLSPDGRFIVFDSDTGNNMCMVEANGDKTRRFLPESTVIRSGGLPCWSPSGSHIAFKEGGTGWLCVFDLATRNVTKIFCEEGLIPLPGCWSPDGKRILFALLDRKNRRCTMWSICPDGTEKQLITGHHEGFYRYLALSPDGSLLVYAAMEGKDLGLWVMPAQGGASIPLAITHPGHNESPAWSPDGKKLAFTSTRSGNFDVWLMHVEVEQLKQELQAAKSPGNSVH